MTWLGGLVLGFGLLLLVALVGRMILHKVRQRRVRSIQASSYAERLEPAANSGIDDEIDKMARDLIREHGADAVIKAARRALAGLDEGESKSQAVWQHVLQMAEGSARMSEGENAVAK